MYLNGIRHKIPQQWKPRKSSANQERVMQSKKNQWKARKSVGKNILSNHNVDIMCFYMYMSLTMHIHIHTSIMYNFANFPHVCSIVRTLQIMIPIIFPWEFSRCTQTLQIINNKKEMESLIMKFCQYMLDICFVKCAVKSMYSS